MDVRTGPSQTPPRPLLPPRARRRPLAASLLTAMPITPSGLGLTETGMVLMLGWLGLDLSTAGAVTLLFRVINYWSIVVFGFLLYVFGRDMNRLNKERLDTPGVSNP
ncbi:MAG: flippase-like domain-containing protein [Actinobacteria bacterium]|nr:flippase-like domain-containing protein [Actinomycetota bacterium]